MADNPLNRLADFWPEMAEEFRCSICLNLFEDAVDTKCKHTYCYQCIHRWITSQGNKQCPQCRQSLAIPNLKSKAVTNSSSTSGAGNNDNKYSKPKPNHIVLYIEDVVLIRNRWLNNFMSRLRVKCEREANGCPAPMTLAEADTNERRCPYVVCERCGLSGGRNSNHEKHNCVDGLLRDRSRWRDQCGQDVDQLRQRVDALTGERAELAVDKEWYRIVADTLNRQTKNMMVNRDRDRSEAYTLRQSVATLRRQWAELVDRPDKCCGREIKALVAENEALAADRDKWRTDADTLRRESAELVRIRERCHAENLNLGHKVDALFREKQWLTACNEQYSQLVDTLRRENKALVNGRSQYRLWPQTPL